MRNPILLLLLALSLSFPASKPVKPATATRPNIIWLVAEDISPAPGAQLPALKTSPNGRFLVTADGKPFFYLADTAWELFHRCSRDEIDYYLRDRAAKGFTVIQAVVLGEINGVTEPNAEGHLPFTDRDPGQPNEAFFALIDYAVERAAHYGLYLAILPTWGAHVEDKAHPLFDNVALFDEKSAYAYGRFLGERWKQHPHILWVFGGDRGPEGYEKIWDRMALGTHAGDGGRLMSYHIYGGRSSSEVFHDAPWLDFNMVQSGHMHPAAPNYEMIAQDYARTPAKPVLDAEPNYEGIVIGFNDASPPFGAFEVRRASYWSVFAGGFGITYGHNCIWQMYAPGRTPILHADIPWQEALHASGSRQLRHLKHLLLSRPYLSRIPDQSLLLDGGASWPAEGTPSNHVQATRDGTPGQADASYLMVYYPSPYRVSIQTSAIVGKSIKAWWYDPREGLAYFIGEFPNTGTFQVPWNHRLRKGMGGPDWVLVIDDAEKDYAPPGL